MRHLIVFFSLGILFLVGCVASEQQQTLDKRIAALETANVRQTTLMSEVTGKQEILSSDLSELKGGLGQGAKSVRENNAEIKYELNLIKERLQQLEGLIEEFNFRFGTNTQVKKGDLEKRLDRLDNAISRNYQKIINLEKYMGFEPTVVEPGEAGASDASAAPGKDSEKGLYAFAKKLFDAGDLENARIQFENFINKYPDSKNADNARFWIADSFYAEKWYEKAILEYQKVLETYPKSNKIAAARLKQGYSFAELGEKANARLILNELIKRHPDSKEAAYAKEKLKTLN